MYEPYRSIVYSICFPTDNNKFPEPIVGWKEATRLTQKYYFDDVFFYLHMYIASESDSKECSKNVKRFANNFNRTTELMDVLTSELKEYISFDFVKILHDDDHNNDKI